MVFTFGPRPGAACRQQAANRPQDLLISQIDRQDRRCFVKTLAGPDQPVPQGAIENVLSRDMHDGPPIGRLLKAAVLTTRGSRVATVAATAALTAAVFTLPAAVSAASNSSKTEAVAPFPR